MKQDEDGYPKISIDVTGGYQPIRNKLLLYIIFINLLTILALIIGAIIHG